MLQQHYDAKMASVEDGKRRPHPLCQDIQSLAAREAALRSQLEAKLNEWKKGLPGMKVDDWGGSKREDEMEDALNVDETCTLDQTKKKKIILYKVQHIR